jgi:hypothetical protein
LPHQPVQGSHLPERLHLDRLDHLHDLISKQSCSQKPRPRKHRLGITLSVDLFNRMNAPEIAALSINWTEAARLHLVRVLEEVERQVAVNKGRVKAVKGERPEWAK